MASYQEPRKTPKPGPRRVREKPASKPPKAKRPEPKGTPKTIFRDWAMF